MMVTGDGTASLVFADFEKKKKTKQSWTSLLLRWDSIDNLELSLPITVLMCDGYKVGLSYVWPRR